MESVLKLSFYPNDSIEKLKLSNRTTNVLINNGYKTIDQFLLLNLNLVHDFRNCGVKSEEEIIKCKNLFENNTYCVSEFNFPRSDIFIHYRENLFIKNEALANFDLTSTLLNKLISNNLEYLSDIIFKTDYELKKIGLSTNLLNKINLLKNNITYYPYRKINIKNYSFIEKFICNNIAFIRIPFNVLAKICIDNLNKNKEKSYLIFNKNLYNNDKVFKSSLSTITNIIAKYNIEGCSLEELNTQLPEDYKKSYLLSESLKYLTSQKVCKIENNKITKIFPTLKKYIYNLPNSRNKKILLGKLSGKTLEEVGNENNLTKERIRQIIHKIIKKTPFLEEDRYIAIFNNYNFSKDEFVGIFNVQGETYEYVSLKAPRINEDEKEDLKDLLNDKNINQLYKKRAKKFIYKDFIKINNSYVYNKRPDVMHFIIKKYCKRPIGKSDFYKLYDRILSTLQLSEEQYNSLKIDDNYDIARYPDVLMSYHSTIRYYNFEEHDFSELYESILLSDYENKEVSTLKFFNDNKRLMKKFNILDEYELHNLIRKTWDSTGSSLHINFSRMPILEIGKINRNEQIFELLKANTPIKSKDFYSLYEETYGINIQNLVKPFEKYLDKGIYNTEIKYLSNEEIVKIKNNLLNDFYLLKDIKKVLKDQLTEYDDNKINASNFYKLGFKSYSGYIISTKYSSAIEYFIDYIEKNEVLNEKLMPKDITSICSFQNAVNYLLDEKKLFEVDDKLFITLNRLNKVGVSIDLINNYIDDVAELSKNTTYFSIGSLPPCESKLSLDKKLGLVNDLFIYDNLIYMEKEKYSSLQVGNGHLFKNTTDEFTIEEFILYLIKEDSYITTGKLISVMKNKYNLKITEKKLINLLKSSDLYITEDFIFKNYESYLEEF